MSRNQIFIVFDSLRWDVFNAAKLPFLKKLGIWKKGYTHATYTGPAHMSFFVGKLPQVYDGSLYYDNVYNKSEPNKNGITRNPTRLWAPKILGFNKQADYLLNGEDIIKGFKNRGYITFGSGAVRWFDPRVKSSEVLIKNFDKFKYFGSGAYAEQQINWAINEVLAAQKKELSYFLFLNFGETHYRYVYKGCCWSGGSWGNRKLSLQRQKKCIEYLDTVIRKLFKYLSNYDLVMCADHGDAMGEDGLWGHGFYHLKVIEVPVFIKTKNK